MQTKVQGFGSATALVARLAGIFLILGISVLASCTTTRLPPPLPTGTGAQNADSKSVPAAKFPTQVSFERAGMTCRAATRAAKAAIKRLGYVIESVVAPSPGNPGEVRALRRTGWYTGDAGSKSYAVAVRITCSDSGSLFEGATEEGFGDRMAFARDLPGEIDRAASRKVSRPRSPVQQPTAELQLILRPLGNSEASAHLGGSPQTIGITPVHIRIANQSEQTYRFATDRLTMMTEERKRQRPIAIAKVLRRTPPEFATRIRESHMDEGSIGPGTVVEGYIYVPTAAYRRAKVVLIDTESEEAEGFSVEF